MGPNRATRMASTSTAKSLKNRWVKEKKRQAKELRRRAKEQLRLESKLRAQGNKAAHAARKRSMTLDSTCSDHLGHIGSFLTKAELWRLSVCSWGMRSHAGIRALLPRSAAPFAGGRNPPWCGQKLRSFSTWEGSLWRHLPPLTGGGRVAAAASLTLPSLSSEAAGAVGLAPPKLVSAAQGKPTSPKYVLGAQDVPMDVPATPSTAELI